MPLLLPLQQQQQQQQQQQEQQQQRLIQLDAWWCVVRGGYNGSPA